MMLRKLTLPIVLLLIAGLSFWLTDTTRDSVPAPQAQRDDRGSDTYMENFTTTLMNVNGQPEYELYARSMAHYPYDDHSEFTAPLITVYRDDGARWTVVSEYGRAEQGTQRILLQGEVTMQRIANGETGIDTEILTRDLLVLPDEDYAETDQAARMNRANSQVDAIGVRAWFEENRVLLLSEVKGVYESR